jgi:6-phosphofructokinase 1
MARPRIGILTGGGDVPPLNAAISAAQKAAARHGIELIGFLKGWEGVIENRYIPLSRLRVNSDIGGTVLKSSRVNLATVPGAPQRVFDNLKRLRLRGLIVIGGEDTLSNSLMLRDFPQVLISKTIDNDVGILRFSNKKVSLSDVINYFTLGYPTAAEKISQFVSLQYGLRSTAYSHERIIVVESMGMHTGWLALASSMGNPDFIILPEFALDYEFFKEQLALRYERNKNVIVVIAEGARWKNGGFVSADENEKDQFGHPRFKGAASVLAERLKQDLKERFDTRNLNAVNPSYLYRSGAPSKLDADLAQKLGTKAVHLLAGDFDESVLLTIQRNSRSFELGTYSIKELGTIQQLHRFVDRTFYKENEYTATREARKYLAEIIEQIPRTEYGVKLKD